MGHCPSEATAESQMPPRSELGRQLGQSQIKLRSQSNYTGPRSAVGNVSGYRCVSDCRYRGLRVRSWPGPILSWRLIMK